MALTPDQLYRLGAEALGWNNSTAAGKAIIAEDMKLLKRLHLSSARAISPPAKPQLHQLVQLGLKARFRRYLPVLRFDPNLDPVLPVAIGADGPK